jgi:hypothetical protein
MPENAVEAASPFQRFVLLAVADLATRGEQPVHSYDVKRVCERYAETIDEELFGGVTRREVIAALSALEESGLLEEATVTSPVGKGRPAYELATDPDAVLAALDGDGRLAPLVERVRGV